VVPIPGRISKREGSLLDKYAKTLEIIGAP
jgi:hypothetical protein